MQEARIRRVVPIQCTNIAIREPKKTAKKARKNTPTPAVATIEAGPPSHVAAMAAKLTQMSSEQNDLLNQVVTLAIANASHTENQDGERLTLQQTTSRIRMLEDDSNTLRAYTTLACDMLSAQRIRSTNLEGKLEDLARNAELQGLSMKVEKDMQRDFLLIANYMEFQARALQRTHALEQASRAAHDTTGPDV